MRRVAVGLLGSVAILCLASSASAQLPSYINFEAGQVRPLAISADGTRLYATNTPDDRLEIFDLTGATPRHLESVAVGLSPIAVAVESASRVWVVNHLSDSVSIVDVASSPPRVVRTLLVGDEPQDIVFAGVTERRAFITTAHRGQNHPVPDGDYDVEGIGRADVWVFAASDLGSPLGGTPRTIVQLFGDRPRALAVSPDQRRVYAAVFHSGNGTTTIGEGTVCNGGPTARACNVGGVTVPFGLPGPMTSHDGSPAPEVGLIVRQSYTTGAWLDELGRDWRSVIRFELPDHDVFAIDAEASTPTEIGRYDHVGTILFSMAVNPSSGALYVSNTEAFNEVRFEGPGTYVRQQGLRGAGPYTVRGRLHESRITVISGTEVEPMRLNPHIDYAMTPPPPGTRDRSIATPLEMAVSSDGETIYLAAYGSSAVAVIPTSDLEAGTLSANPDRLIPLSAASGPSAGPVGPSGLVLDEARGRLYVMTRFDNSVVTVDLASESVTARARMHTPEPAVVIEGRPMLYDAFFTSSNGEQSCGSCHVFGDMDDLAWDLGNPDDEILDSFNPPGPLGSVQPFHPMKGPMTTQSLRGMDHHGPLHWRGDRSGGTRGGDPMDELAGFREFNGAFVGLLGREEGQLRPEEMERFTQFAMRIMYPPNPIRQLDNSLRPDEAAGRNIYFNRAGIDSGVARCNDCHTLDRARQFFGADGRTTFESETQEFKVAHLRNAYQKVGMFGNPPSVFVRNGDNGPTGPQIRGFGFLHDGSIDTVFRFLNAQVFTTSSTDRRQLEAFVMAFDTDLAPIVGQQVTLEGAGDASTDARIQLLIARAEAPHQWAGGITSRECDLVVHGVIAGQEHGWLYDSSADVFRPDRTSEAPLMPNMLRALATMAPLTYTCVPPGTGRRAALDRDEDGTLNRDDMQPSTRTFIDIPDPVLPGSMMMPDAGMPDAGSPGTPDAGAPDAGAPDAGMRDAAVVVVMDAGTATDTGVPDDAGVDAAEHDAGGATGEDAGAERDAASSDAASAEDGAVPGDAAIAEDSGADAAEPVATDAGPRSDAASAADGGARDGGTIRTEGSGCSCRVAPRERSSGPALLGAMLGLALLARKRMRRRS